ncbi:MAG TPA: hypothetical protein VGF27_06320 [Pseudoduganella sp.]
MKRNYAALSSQFDDVLSTIPHYALYPEMMVAVGSHYAGPHGRILVLGESHYLDKPEDSNHPERWYEHREFKLGKSAVNINTRNVFNNAILGRFPSKSKAIFHSLAAALADSGIGPYPMRSPLQSIAYMNFFQRPAERAKLSIKVRPRDVSEAGRVLVDVTAALQPQLIVFASRLGWRHAKESGLLMQLETAGVRTVGVPHPATSWWNRASGPMQGRTGRQRFIEAVLAMKERAALEAAL